MSLIGKKIKVADGSGFAGALYRVNSGDKIEVEAIQGPSGHLSVYITELGKEDGANDIPKVKDKIVKIEMVPSSSKSYPILVALTEKGKIFARGFRPVSQWEDITPNI